ncbi:MAG: YebC/PmpR family DNA-binding transcriptional regulator [Deltaproteobacteria bacterium]|nr:YebC/PmpR family DNA-binding transcriptional regulator [Deltaproteobacteria bacterium]
MSGHSKWSTIKRKKGAADAKRGAKFTKIGKELITAARIGGGDPETNPRLRLAIDKAKAVNMPKDNIERGIKKGSGELEGVSYDEMIYEGYGPGGAAVLLDILTDNKNRTAGEIRHIFTKQGGSMGAPNSVAWMFSKKGYLAIESGSAATEEKIMDVALEAGAEDVRESEGGWEVITEPQDYEKVKQALEAAGLTLASAELSMVPQSTVTLKGDEADHMLRLMSAFEDHDDVQNVYSNFDIPDSEMERLA